MDPDDKVFLWGLAILLLGLPGLVVVAGLSYEIIKAVSGC